MANARRFHSSFGGGGGGGLVSTGDNYCSYGDSLVIEVVIRFSLNFSRLFPTLW